MQYKWKDGEHPVIRLIADPVPYLAKFKPDEPAKQRYILAFILFEADEPSEVRMAYAGPSVFDQLKKAVMNPKWGSPENYNIQIEVDGDGLERSYSLVRDPDGRYKPTEKMKGLVAGARESLEKAVEKSLEAESTVKAQSEFSLYDSYDPFGE